MSDEDKINEAVKGIVSLMCQNLFSLYFGGENRRDEKVREFCHNECPIGKSHTWSCNYPHSDCLVEVWEAWRKEHE